MRKVPKNPGSALRRKTFPHRRGALEKILTSLEVGESLSQEDIAILQGFIGGVLKGYDPRPSLGIRPKAGAPPWGTPFHRAMAVEYWILRDASEKKSAALRLLSTALQVSEPMINKAATQHKAWARSYIDSIPYPADVFAACETIANIWSTHDLPFSAQEVLHACEDEDVLRALSDAATHQQRPELLEALQLLERDKRHRSRLIAVSIEMETMRRLFREIRASDT